MEAKQERSNLIKKKR